MKANDVMVTLGTAKNRGRLRNLTPLSPQARNVTRWTSTFSMLQRYRELHPFLIQRETGFDSSFKAKLLSAIELDTIDHLLASLTNFLEVTISLQSDSIDLLDARMLLDKVIQENELCALYVGPNADIVRYKEFENAVVKVLSQNENDLTPSERCCVSSFLLGGPNHNPENDVGSPELSLLETIKAERLKKQRVFISRYKCLRYVSPTSNCVERLFSVAKIVYSPRRHGMLPVHLEEDLYLLLNKELWNDRTVAKIMAQNK